MDSLTYYSLIEMFFHICMMICGQTFHGMPCWFVCNAVTGVEFAHLSLQLWVFPFPISPLSFSKWPEAPQADYTSFFSSSKNSFPRVFLRRFLGFASRWFIHNGLLTTLWDIPQETRLLMNRRQSCINDLLQPGILLLCCVGRIQVTHMHSS